MSWSEAGTAMVLILASSASWIPRVALADDYYAPKASFLLSSGILSNSGTLGGSTSSLGALDLSISYFLTPKFSIGLSYRADFDFSAGSSPISGVSLDGKYYFMGNGTYTRITSADTEDERLDTWAAYGGADGGSRSFYFQSNSAASSDATTTSPSLSGNYFAIDALVGVEYRLSRHFELDAEGSYTILNFATSDDRVRFQSMLLNIGFSYIF
jgi:hypothetical protein